MASTYTRRSITSAETFNKLTVSCWFKGMADGTQRNFWGIYDNSDNNKFFGLYYSSNGSLYGYWKQDGSIVFTLGTMQKFRDPNAWYHFVMSVDTTLATASDRVKFYLNGERITVFEDSLDTITQSKNINLLDDTNGRMQWGGGKISGTQYYWNGSMSHCHMCVGYAYDASSFGSTDATTGEWKINTSPNVQYGTNGGFWFKDGSQLTDSSTNSNTLTALGTTTINKTEDCPSNVFATLNPLANIGSASTYENGNTTITGNSNWGANPSTIATGTTGKYYAECKVVAQASAYSQFGIMSVEAVPNWTLGYVHTSADAIVWSIDHRSGQSKIESNSSSIISTPTQFSDGDIIGMAIDVDNGKIYFHRNGTYVTYTGYVQNPSSGSYGISLPTSTSGYHIMGNAYPSAKISINFGNGYFGTTAVSSAGTNASGNGIFEYDVPTGYTALSTKGLNL